MKKMTWLARCTAEQVKSVMWEEKVKVQGDLSASLFAMGKSC